MAIGEPIVRPSKTPREDLGLVGLLPRCRELALPRLAFGRDPAGSRRRRAARRGGHAFDHHADAAAVRLAEGGDAKSWPKLLLTGGPSEAGKRLGFVRARRSFGCPRTGPLVRARPAPGSTRSGWLERRYPAACGGATCGAAPRSGLSAERAGAGASRRSRRRPAARGRRPGRRCRWRAPPASSQARA